MYKYVQRFVRNCHVCFRFKSFRQKTQKWLRFLSISQRRWRDVFMNYVNSFSFNIFMNIIYRYIFVFVDRFIKMRHLVLTIIMKIKKVINAYYVYVWKHHELLEFFLFDKNIQFTFDVWNHFCQMFKIDVKLFIAYHSQTNDQTKRINVVMKHYFRAFVNYMLNDWVKWVFEVEFFVNNVFSSIILISFFLTNFDQNFRLRFELSKLLLIALIAQARVKLIDVENFVKKMKELIEHFRDEMLIAQVIYEFNVNVNRCSCSRYFIDDQIWLNVKNFNIVRFVVKLDDHQVNFSQIKRVFDKNSLIIELKLSKSMKIHFIFHVTFFNHVINNFLLDQRQKSREFVVVENNERA